MWARAWLPMPPSNSSANNNASIARDQPHFRETAGLILGTCTRPHIKACLIGSVAVALQAMSPRAEPEANLESSVDCDYHSILLPDRHKIKPSMIGPIVKSYWLSVGFWLLEIPSLLLQRRKGYADILSWPTPPRPWFQGRDLTRRSPGMWLAESGVANSLNDI